MNKETGRQSPYNFWASEYDKARMDGTSRLLYNNFTEVPAMLYAVGNIAGKRLLDVGCGTGIHAVEYVKRGALVHGIDASKSMIDIAKKRCPDVAFNVASAYHLPFESRSFDQVTASLMVFHLDDLDRAFREVNRVLVPNGGFFYSDLSPFSLAREKVFINGVRINGFGHARDMGRGSWGRGLLISYGKAFQEGREEIELLPGMRVEYHRRMTGSHVRALARNGFTLVDVIDCNPKDGLKIHDPEAYEVMARIPVYRVYAAEKRNTASGEKNHD